jgi:hypothetical protein
MCSNRVLRLQAFGDIGNTLLECMAKSRKEVCHALVQGDHYVSET